MKGCEDFLYIILCSHIIVAAERIEKSRDDTSMTLKDISASIVDKFVNFLSDENHGILDEDGEIHRRLSKDFDEDDDDDDYDENSEDVDEDCEHVNEDEDGEEQDEDGEVAGEDDKVADKDCDQVYGYACEVLSLALIWHSYHDAVKEGDGERVMMIWKYLLLIFISTRRTNYSKEVLIQLLQNHYLFSERKAAQLKWDRFVNTQGRPGCNVPADLHMEHLNKRFKGVLRNLGSNIQPHSIVRASKAIGVVHSVSSAFESGLINKKESTKHTTPSMVKDVEKVVDVLKEVNVFKKNKKRKHRSFTFKQGVLASIDRQNVASRLLEKALNAVFQL